MALDESGINERTNALVGWTLALLLFLGSVERLLSGALLWSVFWLLLAGLLATPALATGDRTAMVPWPLPAVAAVALVARAASFHPESAGYLAVVSLALVAVVEIDVFTPVEFSRRFAVVFAVLTTMAVEAVWIIAQYYSDVWLGTAFLSTQTELQEDIVAVSVVGLVAGALFYGYLAAIEPKQPDVDASNRKETP